MVSFVSACKLVWAGPKYLSADGCEGEPCLPSMGTAVCLSTCPPVAEARWPSLLQVDKCKTIVPRSQQHSNPEHAQHLAMHNGTSSVAAPLQPPQASSPAPAPAPAATAPAQPSTQQESDEYVAYIGNVAFEATQEELQDLFAPYGCTQIRMHKDKNSGRPKGFAHAHFGNRASLDRYVPAKHGH